MIVCYIISFGQMGVGQVILLSVDLGYFWFFDFENVEILVKVFDVCGFNQCFWVFVVGFIDLVIELEVEDIDMGQVCCYISLVGEGFGLVIDMVVFVICS